MINAKEIHYMFQGNSSYMSRKLIIFVKEPGVLHIFDEVY